MRRLVAGAGLAKIPVFLNEINDGTSGTENLRNQSPYHARARAHVGRHICSPIVPFIHSYSNIYIYNRALRLGLRMGLRGTIGCRAVPSRAPTYGPAP